MNISPETYEVLSHHKNIVGIKEADPNVTKLIKSLSLCKDRLDFYIGNDDLITTSAYLGCKGVISVVSNILPAYTHNMTTRALKGKIAEANEMQEYILPLIESIFSDVNPIPIKTAMKILKYDIGYLRGPLCDMNQVKIEKLINTLNNYQSVIQQENRISLL
jgi:4-hydroxy-tetrahydrodipicolinate synthase